MTTQGPFRVTNVLKSLHPNEIQKVNDKGICSIKHASSKSFDMVTQMDFVLSYSVTIISILSEL